MQGSKIGLQHLAGGDDKETRTDQDTTDTQSLTCTLRILASSTSQAVMTMSSGRSTPVPSTRKMNVSCIGTGAGKRNGENKESRSRLQAAPPFPPPVSSACIHRPPASPSKQGHQYRNYACLRALA